jgi:hypothetical protein
MFLQRLAQSWASKLQFQMESLIHANFKTKYYENIDPFPAFNRK